MRAPYPIAHISRGSKVRLGLIGSVVIAGSAFAVAQSGDRQPAPPQAVQPTVASSPLPLPTGVPDQQATSSADKPKGGIDCTRGVACPIVMRPQPSEPAPSNAQPPLPEVGPATGPGQPSPGAASKN